jgi:DNA polymerase-3 subunit delta'
VICILPAEAMHPSAANAVLKLLEEPPGETFFLLVSHQPARLLSTIRSRCFHLPVSHPDTGFALDWLKKQGIGRAELALAQGGYAPLVALQRAQDEAFWTERRRLLDLLAASTFDPLLAADVAEDMDAALAAALMAQWAYDVASLKTGAKIRYHLDYDPSLRQIANAVPMEPLMRWYDSLIQFGRVAQHPLNKRLAMENLLAGYPSL